MDTRDIQSSPLDGLDLNLLRTLRALLREESVSRAALELGTTQPTVSRGLATLRDAFGDPLLVRTGRGMVLTPIAKSLITPLEQALSMLDRLAKVGDFDSKTAKRTFRVIVPDVVGCGIMAALRASLEDSPGIGYSALGLEGDALAALLGGRAELVVSAPKIEHSDLYAKVLAPDVSWSVLIGPKHPKWKGKLTLHQWLNSEHAQLVPAGQPERGGAMDTALAKHGRSRKVRVHTSYLSGLGELVESTSMVTTLPTPTALWLAKTRNLQVLAHPFKELQPLKIRLTWHATHQQDEGHRWFRERVGKHLSEFLCNKK